MSEPPTDFGNRSTRRYPPALHPGINTIPNLFTPTGALDFGPPIAAHQGQMPPTPVPHQAGPRRPHLETYPGSGDFGQFMREVVQAASTARSVPVTVDVWGSGTGDPDPPVLPSKGKKRSRADDIPPRELGKEDEETADLFSRIKNRLICERHSKGSNDAYCMVDHNRGKEAKHTRVNLLFIGQWVHACLEGKADEYVPPSCRQLDKMACTRARFESSDDDDTTTCAQPGLSGPSPYSLDFDFNPDELESDSEDSKGRNIPDTITSACGQGGALVLTSSTPGAGPSTTTRPLAGHSSLFNLMPTVLPTRILSIYMSIPDALDALHAAKPNHHFPDLAEAFQSFGYEYVDEVLGMTAQCLAEEIDGLTLPAARVILTFAKAQIQYQATLE
ncbi:unnamed protein product [Rhizoctonia solani]|uniref:Uncharacterized protein n=1 Tax=Rhizoctonia solani TaxID=456999 RepID=A0A8H3EEY2_9AGAM|nr:unnamed protein product [Rhizoctonia solani]